MRVNLYLAHHFIVALCVLFSIPQPQALENINNSNGSMITPLPPPRSQTPKVDLGRTLFHDSRLSSDNSISCAHCHILDQGGADSLAHSFGVRGAKGSINTPTVYNSGLNLAQFWDGRATSLEEQIDGPTHNPDEMASNWEQIIEKLSVDELYKKKFKHIYSNGITSKNIKDAIATFERSLISTGSPFDQFLHGNKDALSAQEKKGYELFNSYGCVSCHQGANVGGNMFQVFGVFGDYFMDRGSLTAADMGRYNVTKLEQDKHKFKVPSLRLVVLTAPYFHDGSIATLEEAIKIMARYQLGRSILDKDVEDIIAFLQSLVGNLQDSP
ncbi:MAG: cytochrome-c peroxidase [Mariprofundaceae bacterium]